MEQMTYVGPVGRLQGKTALIKADPSGQGVLAQFDEIYLYNDPEIGQNDMKNCLWLGWHRFGKDDFEKIPHKGEWDGQGS